jgi:hypothetical protein
MADLFQFPAIQRDRERIALFRTPLPRSREKEAPKLAKQFGIAGKPRDAGARLVVTDRTGTLEIFRASDSLRWSAMHKLKSEDDGADGLPNDEEARGLAKKYLRDRKLLLANAHERGVTHAELSTLRRGRSVPDTKRVAVHVNYGYELDGLPVFGAGAKTRVTFGGRGKALECYHFWRAAKREDERTLLSADAILDVFRRDQAYADLNAEEARVVVHGARFGYLALPPREYQGMLIPVCAVEGTVSTRHLPRYDFRRYVVAVEFAAGETKELGVVFSRLPRVIN